MALILLFDKELVCYINIKLYIFHLILDNIVEGGLHGFTLPDQLLDQQPIVLELATYTRTTE